MSDYDRRNLLVVCITIVACFAILVISATCAGIAATRADRHMREVRYEQCQTLPVVARSGCLR